MEVSTTRPPTSEIPHNLPGQRDAFIGREADLNGLGERLAAGARLVTVMGIGGLGKTRTVTRFGRRRLSEYPGGVWFCDLSEVRDLAGLCAAVASALEAPLLNEDQVVLVGNALAARGRSLVILDNFEQITRLANESLGRWLDQAPEARFIVTSRERLGIPGEEVLPLSTLSVDEASMLFALRARAAKQGFSLRGVEQVVEALVTLLDMLPLAIELAAARARMMSPEQLLTRMNQRFRLLADRRRRDRRSTLRSMLDWSWELLETWEQAALAQCSVFEGGFTLEAAEAVLDLSAYDAPDGLPPWPTDAVQSLIDKSLIRVLDGARFDLLVSVQAYAAEKLTAPGAFSGSGPEASMDAARRHGHHYAEHGAQPALRALDRHGGLALWKALALDRGNLSAACRRAIARGDADVTAATCAATWKVVMRRGPFAEAEALAEQALRVPGLTDTDRLRLDLIVVAAQRLGGQSLPDWDRLERILAMAHATGAHRQICAALFERGLGEIHRGRWEPAIAALEQALGVARETGDALLEAGALNRMATARLQQGQLAESRSLYEATLVIQRRLGNRYAESIALRNLAIVQRTLGDSGLSRATLKRSLIIAREVENRSGEGNALMQLGYLSISAGEYEVAQRRLEQSLAIFQRLGERAPQAGVMTNLAIISANQGRPDEARARFEQALALHRECGNRRIEASTLGNLAILNKQHGRPEARSQFDEALAIMRELGDRVSQIYALKELGSLDELEGLPGQARGSYELALALARETGAQRIEGAVLERLSHLELSEGRLEEAAEHCGEAEALLRRDGDAPALALLLCTRARIEHARADPSAATTLQEIEALSADIEIAEKTELDEDLSALRALLNPPAGR